MAIEIVSFPMKMVIFHSFLYVYQRVDCQKVPLEWEWLCHFKSIEKNSAWYVMSLKLYQQMGQNQCQNVVVFFLK